MKNIFFLTLLSYLCINPSYAQKDGEPCCTIVGLNTVKGIITSRNTATGKVQQFKTPAAGLKNLRMGDKLSIQNGKITAVNETGFEPVNGIVSEQVNDAQPCCAIVSIQVNDAQPCCDFVTVKDNSTGLMHSFQTIAGIGKTLKVGQQVSLQNGYAMVQSGANATAAQKGMYAFATRLDSATIKLKENSSETSAEKWVITPSGAKGATGTVSINLPEGLEWHLDIKSSDDKALGKWDDRWNNKKTINLIPGEYNIFFTYLPVRGVPVLKGMNTRLKAGILNVVTTGQWSLHDESKEKVYVIYYKPSKIGLPVGKYNLKYNEQYQLIEIKEGEVTEF